MCPADLNQTREKAESAAGFSNLGDAAQAAVARHLEGIDFGRQLTGMFPQVEPVESPHSRAIHDLHAATERVPFDPVELEPRPVVLPDESVTREVEMVANLKAMRAELTESGKREAASAKRAEEAERREEETRERTERRERWALGAVIFFGILAVAAPVGLSIL